MSTTPTGLQQRIAAVLGIDIASDTEAVAAARILDAVAKAIGEKHGPRPATSKQVEFGHQLGLDLAQDSIRVASAKLSAELRRRNRAALERLCLMPGDRVLKRITFARDGELQETTQEFTVSSIHESSRVFFKGGNGQGAWPTQLEKAIDGLGT